jgi:hypothetical protein
MRGSRTIKRNICNRVKSKNKIRIYKINGSLDRNRLREGRRAYKSIVLIFRLVLFYTFYGVEP